ncbi:MAG TPA: hypothetical protein VGK67_27090 [Myxococcales bacterium]|jgi:hypothetical protein
MGLSLTCRYEADELVVHLGFAPDGGRVASGADVHAFRSAAEARCSPLKQKVHLFFDLTNLTVEAEQVEAFSASKRELSARFGLSTWHYGGALAERVMVRNDCTRRGEKPNLFKTVEEALAAFRKERRRISAEMPSSGEGARRR